MLPYERFDAWRMSHRLALQVYEITDRWPAQEKYGLIAQVRRAALSAAANIAEGSAKRGRVKTLLGYKPWLIIGSVLHLRFSGDRGLLPAADFKVLDDLRDQAGKPDLAALLISAQRRSITTALPPYHLTASPDTPASRKTHRSPVPAETS
jgi:hypothetical protein